MTYPIWPERDAKRLLPPPQTHFIAIPAADNVSGVGHTEARPPRSNGAWRPGVEEYRSHGEREVGEVS